MASLVIQKSLVKWWANKSSTLHSTIRVQNDLSRPGTGGVVWPGEQLSAPLYLGGLVQGREINSLCMNDISPSRDNNSMDVEESMG